MGKKAANKYLNWRRKWKLDVCMIKSIFKLLQTSFLHKTSKKCILIELNII